MAAQRVGKELLDGVKEETLDEFLNDLRALIVPPKKDVIGIDIFDRVIEVLQSPLRSSESRRWSSPGQYADMEDERFTPYIQDQPDLERARSDGRSCNPVLVEVLTPAEASILNGPALQTAFCTYLTALAALPPRSAAVVYISTSPSKFAASQLYAQMLAILSLRSRDDHSITEESLRKAAQEALSHVHIFKPVGTAQLVETLRQMPEYLSDSSKHTSAYRELGLVVLDSIDAFYWKDRMQDEKARLDPPPMGSTVDTSNIEESTHRGRDQSPKVDYGKSSSAILSANVKRILWELASVYSSPVAYTRTSHSPWQVLASPSHPQTQIHIQLSSLAISIPQFPAHLSVQGALQDRSKRRDVVRRGEYVGMVQEGHEGEWRRDVKEKIRELVGESAEANKLKWRFAFQSGVILEHQDTERF